MKQVILRPIITEKAIRLSSTNQYVFEVSKESTKSEIKKEISRLFKVHVEAVNITYQREKKRRRGRFWGKSSGYKKAVVALKKGETIKELEVKK